MLRERGGSSWQGKRHGFPLFLVLLLCKPCLCYETKDDQVPSDQQKILRPVPVGAFGDPHIITMDNAEYTFNGWGEYTLLSVDSEETTFTLQGRTDLYKKVSGTPIHATVFTAFGSREGTGQVFVELDKVTKTSMNINADGRDLTPSFRDNRAFTWETDDLLIKRHNQSFYAEFSSGIIIQVSVHVRSLAVSVIVPLAFTNKTSGLMGNFNGDRDDEFILPKGARLPSDMTERELFHNFGNAWAVKEADTVMRYEEGKGPKDYVHPEFTPIFLDEQPEEAVRAAKALCGDHSIACIYDFIATGDRDLALDSKGVEENAFRNRKIEPAYFACRHRDCPTENGGCSKGQCFCHTGYRLLASNVCEPVVWNLPLVIGLAGGIVLLAAIVGVAILCLRKGHRNGTLKGTTFATSTTEKPYIITDMTHIATPSDAGALPKKLPV